MLGDDCNGQVSESTVLKNSYSDSEFLEIFESENDLSDIANRVEKPAVIQIIRN